MIYLVQLCMYCMSNSNTTLKYNVCFCVCSKCNGKIERPAKWHCKDERTGCYKKQAQGRSITQMRNRKTKVTDGLSKENQS